jgi:hypothetical protein
MSSISKACDGGVRQISFPDDGGEVPGFDAVACVGKPFTASPPAVPVSGQ